MTPDSFQSPERPLAPVFIAGNEIILFQGDGVQALIERDPGDTTQAPDTKLSMGDGEEAAVILPFEPPLPLVQTIENDGWAFDGREAA
jgi:hypothetical protein